MKYLVMIQHSHVAQGSPSAEFFVYESFAGDVDVDWSRVKAMYAKAGDTVSMGMITHKCIPATHVDAPV